MLPRLLRPTLTHTLPSLLTASTLLTTSILPLRAFSTTTTPHPTMANTPLPIVLTPTLYTHLLTFWFAGTPPNATAPAFSSIQRWYGVGLAAEQKRAFDEECRRKFGSAVEALGPEHITLPAEGSVEADLAQGDGQGQGVVAALAAEVERGGEGLEGGEALRGKVERLLSLVLLLDQMPRNLFREPEGLRDVYGHYDRLALGLFYAATGARPPVGEGGEDAAVLPDMLDPVQCGLTPVWRSWLLMPLMHSEHLPSHALYTAIATRWRDEARAAGDEDGAGFLQTGLDFEERHVQLVRRFGRYPHRNEGLGRMNTGAESTYLREGGETFGVGRGGGEKGEGKDEL